MTRSYTPMAKVMTRLQDYVNKKAEQYEMPLFARKLFLIFTKYVFKHYADHYPWWSETYLWTIKERFVRHLAHNFWLDEIPPFDEYTLNELLALDYDKVCELIDNSGQILVPIKHLIQDALAFVYPIACHIMANVPLGYFRYKWYHALRLPPEMITERTRQRIEPVRIGFKISKVEPEIGLRVIVVSM